MSLKTWKEEYYPKNPTKRMSKLEAIHHSLRKWEGLLPANLKKHNVDNVAPEIEDKDSFSADFDQMSIDGETCALCIKYLDSNLVGYDDDDDEDFIAFVKCSKCPLYKSLGHSCDVHWIYGAWSGSGENRGGNPKPMIKALKKCLEENGG